MRETAAALALLPDTPLEPLRPSSGHGSRKRSRPTVSKTTGRATRSRRATSSRHAARRVPGGSHRSPWPPRSRSCCWRWRSSRCRAGSTAHTGPDRPRWPPPSTAPPGCRRPHRGPGVGVGRDARPRRAAARRDGLPARRPPARARAGPDVPAVGVDRTEGCAGRGVGGRARTGPHRGRVPRERTGARVRDDRGARGRRRAVAASSRSRAHPFPNIAPWPSGYTSTSRSARRAATTATSRPGRIART